MSMMTVPWVLGFITAGWFGVLAVRRGRNVALWALAGGLFGLISSTFVFGLGHASSIPFSDKERTTLQLQWTLISIGLIVVVGALFTWTMWAKPPDEGLPAPKMPSPATPPDQKKMS